MRSSVHSHHSITLPCNLSPPAVRRRETLYRFPVERRDAAVTERNPVFGWPRLTGFNSRAYLDINKLINKQIINRKQQQNINLQKAFDQQPGGFAIRRNQFVVSHSF